MKLDPFLIWDSQIASPPDFYSLSNIDYGNHETILQSSHDKGLFVFFDSVELTNEVVFILGEN